MAEYIRHSSSAVSNTDFRHIRNLARDNFVGYGQLCKKLETQLANKFNRTSVVLASSGEGALVLALHELKSQRSDKNEIVVSSYVCPAVVNAIQSQGLQPVFADVARDSLNLSVHDVKQRLTKHTLAIICTHMGGFPDDIDAASQFGITVISDCAQAIGSSISGRPLLSFGDMAITSFGPTKYLTGGLGGAVLCDEKNTASMRRMAMPELSVAEYQEQGFISTLGQHFSDINAGLVLAQLEKLERFVQKRRRIAKLYDKALETASGLVFPEQIAGAEPNWFRYYFFSDHASEWQRRLQKLGVDARTSISHVMTDYFPGSGARAELARQARRVVSLPIYPVLNTEQVTRIIEALQCVAAEQERNT